MLALMSYAIRNYGWEAVHQAWRDFVLQDESASPPEIFDPQLQLFLPWFAHVWSPAGSPPSRRQYLVSGV